MTDYELYHYMRTKGFTEYGASATVEVRKDYPTLYKFYDEYMGNFSFNDEEVSLYIEDIKRYIKNHNKCALIYSYNEAYEGKNWWLTTEC